jgi:hypothetical protein
MDRFMPTPSKSKARVGISVFLLAWMVLGLTPPASPSAPETVIETLSLDPADLAGPAHRTATALDLPAETWSRSDRVCPGFRFTMVGFTWRGAGHADAAVTWAGGFLPAEADEHEGPDPGSPDDSGIQGTSLAWTGETRCVNVRFRTHDGAPLKGLRATFLNTSGTATDPGLLSSIGTGFVRAWSSVAGLWSPAPAGAWTNQPRIRSRNEWGADESLRKVNCNGKPVIADRLEVAYIHHTASGNSYSKGKADDQIRGIYAYHVHSRGFCDIAYNFVVDKWGRAWEGRYGGIDKPVVGGHAMGFNTRSTGIVVLGTYTNKEPGARLLRTLKRLVRWRMDVAHVRPGGRSYMTSAGGSSQKYAEGQTVRLRSVIPHRRTGYTSCPGDALARKIGSIRRRANRTGHPKLYRPSRSSSQLVHTENDVRFQATLSRVGRWRLTITDATGTVVRAFTAKTGAAEAVWNGQDANGIPVPDGDYRATFTGRWEKQDARPATLFVRVCAAADPSTGLCPAPPP